MGEVVPARTSLTLLPHPLALCCHYPVSKCRSASIAVTGTLRVKCACSQQISLTNSYAVYYLSDVIVVFTLYFAIENIQHPSRKHVDENMAFDANSIRINT